MKTPQTLWQITEELDAIKCPHCGGYNRLSIAENLTVYCAECGDGITAEYLAAHCFDLASKLQSAQ